MSSIFYELWSLIINFYIQICIPFLPGNESVSSSGFWTQIPQFHRILETVEIIGQFRSYNYHEGVKNRLILSVFAREIRFIDEFNDYTKTNQIYLNGYVCKTPGYRKTPLGREITDLLIAVNRPYGKSDYIPCIAWGRNARYAAGFSVGSNIELWGRVQSREYTKIIGENQNEKRVAYEVSVSKLGC